MARRKPAKVHGFLAVDKRAGLSSRAVVNKVGWLLQERRAGHTGTLDPGATGLLIVAFGEATKTVRWLTDHAKTYETDVVFGSSTTTDDADGEVVRRAPLPAVWNAELVRAAANGPTGWIEQVPPSVSALKTDGVRDYERVRMGETVQREARRVRLDSVRMLSFDGESARFELTVGAGFYVRSWARDLGERLGTAAHVGTLRRTAGGGFSVDDALTVEALEAVPPEDRCGLLIPVGDVMRRVLPVLKVDEATETALGFGQKPFAPDHVLQWPHFLVVGPDDLPICIARTRDDMPGGARLQVERGFGEGARNPVQIA